MLWMLLVAAASAQTHRVGIENHPDYAVYMRAIDALGTEITPTRPITQIGPGVIGFVDDRSGVEMGEWAVVNTLVSPPHYKEGMVLYTDQIESLSEDGFIFGFKSPLPADTIVALNAFILAHKNVDDNDHTADYRLSNMSLTNKSIPTGPQVAAVPPLFASDPDYDLYAFNLYQNGVLVGHMLRERFIYADDSESWRDFWFFKVNYKMIQNVNPVPPPVDVVPWPPSTAPQTSFEFFNTIPLAQMNVYQNSNLYGQQTLF